MKAVVIGSGPNGLAGAIELARAGLEVEVREAEPDVGGGLRSAELTLPGFVHDVCSAVHPLAVASPVFRELERGVEWVQPDAPAAHPFDDGTALVLERGVAETAGQLGPDAAAYRELVDPLAGAWHEIERVLLGPYPLSPKALVALRRGLGSRGLIEALRDSLAAARPLIEGRFADEPTRAWLAGFAAHSILPLERRPSAGFALALVVLGHVVGWPFPRGGAQRLAEALAGRLRELGGEVNTASPVEVLPAADVVLADVAPRELLSGGRASPGALRATAPCVPAWAGSVQGRLGARRPDSLVVSGVHARRHGASRRLVRGDLRLGVGRLERTARRQAVRPACADVALRSVACAGGAPGRLGVLPCAERLVRGHDRADRVAGRALCATLPRADSRAARDGPGRAGGAQPQPRRG